MADIFCAVLVESETPKSDLFNLYSNAGLTVLGRDHDTLDYIELSDNAVEERLSRINQHKPPGQDGIPALFLKKFHTCLAPIIRHAFNASLFVGHFPKTIKKSTVMSLYKGKKV